jgi:heme exporter protein A
MGVWVLGPAKRNGTFELTIDSVSKSYGSRRVLRDVTAHAVAGQVLVIAGPNGSGKSTLVKMIARLIRPTDGRVLWKLDGQTLPAADARKVVGMVSPDLTFYDELSAIENLRFFAQVRGLSARSELAESLLGRFGLGGRGRDPVGAYSSGMKQRLKYAFALMHDPPLLLVDEPTANLDERGVALVYDAIAQARLSKCIVIATNEPEEVRLGDVIIQLGA